MCLHCGYQQLSWFGLFAASGDAVCHPFISVISFNITCTLGIVYCKEMNEHLNNWRLVNITEWTDELLS